MAGANAEYGAAGSNRLYVDNKTLVYTSDTSISDPSNMTLLTLETDDNVTYVRPAGAKYVFIASSDYTSLDEATLIIKKGTDALSGAPVVDDTLTAVCDATDVSYQWYRGNTAITNATEATYTVTTSDVGSTIKVKATQLKDENGSDLSNPRTKMSSETSAVVKKTGPAAPADAEIAEFVPDYEDETFTIGNDYEVSSTNGSTAAVITNLTAVLSSDTAVVYIRKKETPSTQPGEWLTVNLTERPAAPTGLETEKASSPTTQDGKIINADTTLQYKLDDDSVTVWTNFDGTEAAVKAGTATDGTMKYAVTDDGNWTKGKDQT